MSQGIADELAGICLGDERLNQRSRKVIEALAANPEASINAAVNGWGDTQAAYRFFNNANVTPAQILEPHRQATLQRMQEHSVVLVAQDTTELDYSDHPTRDALCLNQESRFGLYHHVRDQRGGSRGGHLRHLPGSAEHFRSPGGLSHSCP